jgi:hypothetical protein
VAVAVVLIQVLAELVALAVVATAAVVFLPPQVLVERRTLAVAVVVVAVVRMVVPGVPGLLFFLYPLKQLSLSRVV